MCMKSKALGDTIRQARIKANMSQEELAEKLNITPSHLKHLESEHRHPSVEVLFQLATTLNISIDSMLFPVSDEKTENMDQIKLLLNKCTVEELKIIEDLIRSLLLHRP